MRLAVRIENARQRINPHPTSSVLVAYTFNGNPLFEICVQRHGRRGVAGSFKSIDPAVFEAFKTLHIVGRVGKLNTIRGIVRNAFGFVGVAGIA